MSRYPRSPQVRDFLLGALATYGALWLAVESISAFFVSLKPRGFAEYSVLLALAALGGFIRAWPKARVTCQVPASDSWFVIQFGNIFDGDAVTVIPVNDHFDAELGDHVAERSLHGQFIKHVLGGQSEAFAALTRKALADVVPEEPAVARSSGRNRRYAIGTVAPVDINDRRYLLVALSHTDPESLKASASLHDLWTCLAEAWRGIRHYSNGRPVSIPLVGAGLSGTGLPPQQLIDIMMTSFLLHTKEKKVAGEVTLVLTKHLERDVDLRKIARRWS